MRRHYSTEQYAVYKQEAAEELWGQMRWRTQLALQRRRTNRGFSH